MDNLIIIILLTIDCLLRQVESASVLPAVISVANGSNVEITPATGNWTPDTSHDAGVIRVSNDGPKPVVQADPVLEIGTSPPITEEFILSHPNYDYLSPLSECGVHNVRSFFTDDVLEGFDHVDIGEDQIKLNLELTEEIRKKRIVGGRVIQNSQVHPWMVQLYLLKVSTGERFFHCAGTLISNQTVLTAGHCLTRIQPGTTLDVVVIGNNDRRQTKFCTTSDPMEKCSRDIIRVIEDVEVHEEYSEGNLNHDIGLIYLKQPVKISPTVRPICLPYSYKLLENWKNIKLQALGWGSTNKYTDGDDSDILKQVELDLQTRDLCDKFHVRIYGRTLEDRICTGGNIGRGTCNGDSGGGIVKTLEVQKLDGAQRVFQIGIVSAGGHSVDSCGFQGRPTIDTNVLFYMEWILNHIVPGATWYAYKTKNSTWVECGNKDQKVDPLKTEVEYKNEFSTGREIDVSQHPNIDLLPSFSECGRVMGKDEVITKFTDDLDARRLKRIVGGVPTYLDQYLPWMAQVYVRNVQTNEVTLRCSGSIISKSHILSAAHCCTEIVSPFVFDGVIVGQYNRNSTRECIGGVCYSPISVKIADVIIHSEYEKYTHKNNIALIRLGTNLTFTRMVQPICLPRREVLTNGINIMRFFTAGWGRIQRDAQSGPESKLSEILLQVYLELLPRRDCDFVYSRVVDMLDRSRLCAGGKASRGECVGDGGSPLMKTLEMDPTHVLHNKVFQLGIVSFTDCGMEGMPTVYSNIMYYLKWILDNLDDPDV